jgi:hypothetical protein
MCPMCLCAYVFQKKSKSVKYFYVFMKHPKLSNLKSQNTEGVSDFQFRHPLSILRPEFDNQSNSTIFAALILLEKSFSKIVFRSTICLLENCTFIKLSTNARISREVFLT